uniref:Cysteine-rich membrane protein 2 n=1 Tax=Spironucleus salmonicida TaxID=348837 RepID=V6LQ62_9EUKA|eukprot:EST45851.1 Cysteine-rich membrane protein 2 [Spironucleus salmonicida]
MSNCTDPNCNDCQMGPDECFNCSPGYILDNNKCVTKCPETQYANEYAVCVPCSGGSPGCIQCTQADITSQHLKCTECFENFTLAAGSCKCNLPNCQECDPAVPNQCKMCVSPTHFLNIQKLCISCTTLPNCAECAQSHSTAACTKCQKKFFLQGQQCVPVTPNCAVVTESNTCEKCNDGFALNTANACGTCDAIIDFASPDCTCGVAENCGNCAKDLDACGACLGSFEMKDGKCVQGACAVANCGTCRDRPDSCMACAGGFQLTILDSCQESCAGVGENGQFCRAGAARAAEWVACPADATGVAQMLTDCICGSAENCGNCSADGQCGACLPGYQQRNGSCTECADGFLRQPSNGLCARTSSPDQPKDGFTAGAIIGIVVVVILIVCACIGAVMVYKKRKLEKAETPLNVSELSN